MDTAARREAQESDRHRREVAKGNDSQQAEVLALTAHGRDFRAREHPDNLMTVTR